MIGWLVRWVAGSRFAPAVGRWAAVLLTVVLFLAAFRRTAERAGRLAERLEQLENTNEAQRRMLEAVAHRPRSRDDIAHRLRGGRF